jgi:hypothetical protein
VRVTSVIFTRGRRLHSWWLKFTCSVRTAFSRVLILQTGVASPIVRKLTRGCADSDEPTVTPGANAFIYGLRNIPEDE